MAQDASYTDADEVLALITGAIGAPETESTPKGDMHRWGDDVSAFTQGLSATVRFGAAEVNGVELRTSSGVAVGSTRADVEALNPFGTGYDGDGDGLPDTAGLDPVEEPGTESLVIPGTVGTSYVLVVFTGDVVSGLAAPGGDWRDL